MSYAAGEPIFEAPGGGPTFEVTRTEIGTVTGLRLADAAHAAADPFSFFYLPETDPTRADSHTEQTAPEAGESREGPFAERVHESKYGRRWLNCPGLFNNLSRYAREPFVPPPPHPHSFFIERHLDADYEVFRGIKLDRPAYPQEVRVGGLRHEVSFSVDPSILGGGALDRETIERAMRHVGLAAERAAREAIEGGPRREGEVRVMRGGRTVGYVPRPQGERVGSCRLFQLEEDSQIEVDGQACLAGISPPGLQFILLYGLWSSDGGWTHETVLDAADVSMDLIERIPGWRSSSN